MSSSSSQSSRGGGWRGRGGRGQYHGDGGQERGRGRGQYHGDGGQERGRGRGQYQGEGRQGGERGRGQYQDAGGWRGVRGRGQYQDDGGQGRGRGQYQGDGREGGERGRGQYHDAGAWRGGRGRGQYRDDGGWREPGTSRDGPPRGGGHQRGGRGGSRGPRGGGRGGFAPVEKSIALPDYAAKKDQVKFYDISDELMIIPARTGIKVHSRYFTDMKQPLEVNCLKITFTKPEKMPIFHYNVQIEPNLPKHLLRKVMEEMRKKFYSDRNPGFDGEASLFAAGARLIDHDKLTTGDGEGRLKVTNDENEQVILFKVTLTLVSASLTVANLMNYRKGGTSLRRLVEHQAIEIALKGNLHTHFMPVGKRAFFPEHGDAIRMSAGMELRSGLFQGVIVSDNVYLNVDVAHKGFPIAQSIINYLKNVLGRTPTELSSAEREGLEAYLKNLKVCYSDPRKRKRNYKNLKVVAGTPSQIQFEQNGSRITITAYYKSTYSYDIQYPNLPLLMAGTDKSPKYLPMELCEIASKQAVVKAYNSDETRVMVDNCCDSPESRKNKILRNVVEARYNEDEVLRSEFGIEVKKDFEQVNSMLLQTPRIKYGTPAYSNVMNGVWRASPFHKSAALRSWAILNKANEREAADAINACINLFIQGAGPLHFNLQRPAYILNSDALSKDAIKNDFAELKAKVNDVQLIMVVLPPPPNDKFVYEWTKCISELNEGILTQCVKWKTLEKMFQKPYQAGTTASNILLKINTKLGGVNHVVEEVESEEIMYVGADVTHASPGSTNPSIATVVGSYNGNACQYKTIFTVQESRCENIVKMEEVMLQLLKFRKEANGRYPTKIFYYRDGVSEGQFEEMKKTELMAIKRAGEILNIANFRVTFVVVQKRHHIRFFPYQGDKNGNVFAGTVVNQGITHPTEHDFYLTSHQSIKGTARPTKYSVIHNETKTPDDELEAMTFHLCHVFSRCTRSVKYPTPTYYAHLSGKRAEIHVRGAHDGSANEVSLLTRGDIREDMASRNPMFFV